jgi:hypothetical protein
MPSKSSVTGISTPISGYTVVSSAIRVVTVYFWLPASRSRTVVPMLADSMMT